MEPKLQEGLDKLKKLDPRTWAEFNRPLTIDGKEVLPGEWPEPLIMARLQGMIQKEIAERGWVWQLDSRGEAFIFAKDRPDEDDTWSLIAHVEALDNEAEAILLAFVAALEASK